MAGKEIFQSRKKLRAFNKKPDYPTGNEDIFDSHKTTEVNITSEVVPITRIDAKSTTVSANVPSRSPLGQGYDRYTVTIRSAPLNPRIIIPLAPSGETLTYRKNPPATEANTAAWAYTKCAVLFFISLLITWVSHCLPNALRNRSQVLVETSIADLRSQVPSSINRVYTLVYPDHVSVTCTFAAGVVLPLMGFWNSVIYITISWKPCKMLFRGIFSRLSEVSHQQCSPLRSRSRKIVEQRSGRATYSSNDGFSESTKQLACSDEVESV